MPGRFLRSSVENDAAYQQVAQQDVDVDDALIHEKLIEVAAYFRFLRSIRGTQINQDQAGGTHVGDLPFTV